MSWRRSGTKKGETLQRWDNDDWDLSSSVGATATMTAAARAAATNAPGAIINDYLAEPLVRAVGIDFFTRWAARQLPSESDDAGLGWQPMTNALAVRTRYFDDFLLDACAAGIRQVVLLASGLDTRGYRLALPEDTTLFDIDQPRVVAFKDATLSGLGITPSIQIRYVGIDLRKAWDAALRQAGFNVGLPTAWVAEGLLAYLPSGAQDRLLDTITALSANGSRLAAEVFRVRNMTALSDTAANVGTAVFVDVDDTASEQVRYRARHIAEQWQSFGLNIDMKGLAYQDDRSDLAGYLRRQGWTSTTASMSDLFAASGLTLRGDQRSGDAFADNYLCTSFRP